MRYYKHFNGAKFLKSSRKSTLNRHRNSTLTHAISCARFPLQYGTEMVKLLVESGADVNAAGALEDTPLTSASRMELTEIVRILLDAGADISAKDQFGFTPLAVAVKNNHTGIVKYLKEKGAIE